MAHTHPTPPFIPYPCQETQNASPVNNQTPLRTHPPSTLWTLTPTAAQAIMQTHLAQYTIVNPYLHPVNWIILTHLPTCHQMQLNPHFQLRLCFRSRLHSRPNLPFRLRLHFTVTHQLHQHTATNYQQNHSAPNNTSAKSHQSKIGQNGMITFTAFNPCNPLFSLHSVLSMNQTA